MIILCGILANRFQSFSFAFCQTSQNNGETVEFFFKFEISCKKPVANLHQTLQLQLSSLYTGFSVMGIFILIFTALYVHNYKIFQF